MRKTIVGLAVGFVLGGAVSAQAIAGLWRSESPYRAVIRCQNIAEDSAAHLRLVEYQRNADGTLRLIYRCRTTGY